MGEESKVTVESGLSTFQDEEEKILTLPIDNVPGYNVSNPYPDQTPQQILARWYQINSKTYTATSIEAYTTFPIDDLFQIEVIKFALQSFQYFRWSAIEFRLQYSTVPMVYGWLGVTGLPHFGANPTFRQILSHTDTVLLDLSCQQDVTIVTPWISPEQWLDLSLYYSSSTSTYLDSVDHCHRCTIYNQANPVQLLDTLATNTIVVQVFARFVGPETAAHIDALVDNSFTAQMQGFGPFEGIHQLFGARQLFGGTQAMPFRGNNPNDEFGPMIRESLNATQTKTEPKSPFTPSGDPDEPELKPNLYGSLVISNPKYVLGSGNQFTGSQNMSVLDIMRIPTFVANGIMDDSFVYHLWPIDRYSRISYMSQMYRMWRGSIEYTFVFFSSPFVTARVNLFIVYPGDALGAIGTLGNKIIQDVTIRGTTRVSFTVPYLYGEQWQPTRWQSSTTAFPRLQMKVIQAPESISDVVPAIFYVMYEVAAPDFRFRSLCNPSGTYSAPFEAQMRTSEFVASRDLFSGKSSKLNYKDDTELDLKTLISRWSYSHPNSYRSPFPDQTLLVDSGVFATLSRLYLMRSGQIKHKCVIPPVDPEAQNPYAQIAVKMETNIHAVVLGIPDVSRVEDGLTLISNQVTQVLEFVVPFLATCGFVPIHNRTLHAFNDQRLIWSPLIFSQGVSIVPSVDLVSGGPDFSFYYPLPPPELDIWPAHSLGPEPVLVQKNPTNLRSPTVSFSEYSDSEKTL